MGMRKTIKIAFIALFALILAALAVAAHSTRPVSLSMQAADLEPSTAGAASPAPVPVPARPALKKDSPDQVTTIIPDSPQANNQNGAPRILKTELGYEVSPLCFEQLFGPDGPRTDALDVTTCEQVSGYKNIRTGLEEGRYRTVYDFPSEPDMPAEKGFSSYELLGAVAGGTAVELYNETGGTGRFSSIILVTLQGNMLKLVDQIAGGDRCNGGITDAKIENGQLVYSVNATPGDFPLMAWNEDKGIKAYEDLEASAMSCFGIATYKDHSLAAVELVPDAVQDGSDWSEQYSMQTCFNRKFKEAVTAGQIRMSAQNFKVFMDGFLAECGRK